MIAMQGRPTTLLAFAAITWVAGIALSVGVVAADGPARGDVRLTRAVQAWPDWLEPAARVLRSVTGTEIILIAGFAFAAVLFIARMRAAALALALGMILLPIAQGGTKQLVDRERPDPAVVEVRDDWTSPSYPSGHVMSGTLFYAYLALSRAAQRRLDPWMKDIVRLGAVAIIAGNAVANVYMGVHWPTDVLGGLLFGSGLACAVVSLERHLEGPASPG
jgi:membrane-associated phospholipid phosphatase